MDYKVKYIPKNAGFFIRFLANLIDIVIFVVFGMLLSLICIGKGSIPIDNNKTIELYLVTKWYAYYIWLVSLILMIIVESIVIPYFFKGRTLGMLITQLTILWNDDDLLIKKIFKRWQLGWFIWMIIILLFLAFISPKIVNKLIVFSFINNNPKEFANMDQIAMNNFINSHKLNFIETMFLTIPSSISSFTIIAQVLLLMSIGASKNKIGIIDKLTNTRITYKKKVVEIKEKEIKIPKPEKIENIEIIWKN